MNANIRPTFLTSQRRFLLLIATMAVVAVAVAGATQFVLYQAAFEGQRQRLIETASAQASVIEVLAHFNEHGSSEHPLDSTLHQITAAYDQWMGSRETGEFTLATLEDGQIVFLTTRQQAGTNTMQRIPLDSNLAEPMRRALSGQSGTVVGLDYQGHTVMAAYEPVHVDGITLGIVAKVDLEEIRAPFVQAGLLSGGVGLVVIVLGGALFWAIGTPIIRGLEESEAKYRTLIEQSLQSVLIVQTDPLRLSFVNNTMQGTIGYTSEELLGFTPAQIRSAIHPEDQERLFENLSRRMKGQEVADREIYRIIAKNGELHWMETFSTRIEYAGEPAVMALFIDTTERKRAEEASRESEARYRSLFERVPVGLFRSLPGGRVIEANPALVQMVGYASREALLAADASQLFASPEERKRWQTLIEADGMIQGFEAHFKRADGRLIWCRGTARAIKDADGKIVSYEGSLEDITRRKQVEEEVRLLNAELEKRVRERTAALRAANEELEALGRVKSEFVSNVSHELRTPITTVKLYLQLLQQCPDRLDRYLPVLERESERLAQIIEGLLHFSLIDQNRVDLQLEAVDLNRLVQQYVADRTMLAAKSNLSLQFLDGVPMQPIKADARLLGQVVSILLTNAINYTPSGGQVTVRMQARAKGEQRYVGFAVSDTGPGIPPDEIDQIFERFYRGQAAEESRVSGTGLGLSIAKGIVEQHQGQIEVESEGEPGKGATFKVWFPAHKVEAEKSPVQT